MVKLNCVVLDDSSIQRITINKLVNNHPNLNLLGDFSNAIEARSYIAINDVDLIFLDIEMPVISGFEFLDGLKVKPQIIFITAKEDYAVKAFDYEATDYIKKPITLERFNSAIRRATDWYNLRNDPTADTEFIYIKSNLKRLKVFTHKIKYIEALGDYVKVITEDDSHLVLSTMKSFENELPKTKFVRVHKSFIINATKVERYNSKFAEIGNIKIPLSREKKKNLVLALNPNTPVSNEE